MYHAHFRLTQEPFGVSPDCRFFYQTDQHGEALATLYYAIQQRRGFALLVGRPGLGKTSVLVQLVQMLEGKAEIAYLPHPYYDRSTVLESILLSLGLPAGPSLAQSHRVFYEYLLKLRLSGKTCVVLLDEAQDLDLSTLEAIRMLSNFETPSEKLLQIVLAGQPRLAETLKRPECEQLLQRMNVVARLEPLAVREVQDYIEHRLNAAGNSSKLFLPDALEAIVAASHGAPRNVNTICFNALTLAYALSHQRVGFEEVSEAVRDLDLSVALPVVLPKDSNPQREARSSGPPFRRPSQTPAPAGIAAGVVLFTAGVFLSRLLSGLR
jgi:type II secretory pathway predicted ATPase ExeA